MSQEEARIALSYLRANGIDAELADANTYSTLPHVGMGITMLRLVAPEEEVQEARQLLDSVNAGETAFTGDYLDDEFIGRPDDKHAGSGVFLRYRWLIVFLFALSVIFLF